MALTKLTSKGVVIEKNGGDAVKITVPTVFDGTAATVRFSGAVTFDSGITLRAHDFTSDSGSFTITNGQALLSRISGSGTSGFLKLGSAPNIANTDQVLLVVSGAAGEGLRNGIMLFASGAHNGTNAAGAGGVTNGGGGNEGIFQSPPAGSVYIYTDGVNLWFRNSSTVAKILATGSTGVPV